MDEVVCGMLEKIIPLYNTKYKRNLTLSQITQYDIAQFVDSKCINIFEEFLDEELILSLDLLDGAADALSDLNRWHELYFVTAGHPYTMRARDDWLQVHLPFYRSGQLIGCRNKQLLGLDVLIDDYEGNLVEGNYFGLLFDKPWNEQFPERLYNIKRFYSWDEIPSIIGKRRKAPAFRHGDIRR